MPILSLKTTWTAKIGSVGGDAVVSGLGVSAAVLSATFAGYMILSTSASPTRRPVTMADLDRDRSAINIAAGGPPPAPASVAPAADIDFTPTGSVESGSAAPHLERARAGEAGTHDGLVTLPDFRVRDVFDGTALIETRDTIRLVTAGTALEGAGTVVAIRRDGRAWVVQTTEGVIKQKR